MAKHLWKILLLFIPSFISIMLLIFCLSSDWWSTVNYAKLDRVRNMYEEEFKVFYYSKSDKINISSNLDSTTTSTTTKQITSLNKKLDNEETSSSNINNEQFAEQDEQEDQEADTEQQGSNNMEYEQISDEEDQENKKKKLRKRASSGKSTESIINDSGDNNYEDDDYPTEKADEEIKKIDATNQALESNQYKTKLNDKDYVYITKLWPFVIYKSLYSECTYFEKMQLKISVAYLNKPNKEPIVGQINYGIEPKSDSDCIGKIGQTRCLLTNTCITGYRCDGIVDCPDQSDEHFCQDTKPCRSQMSFKCDNRCWNSWMKCDQVPHCFNLSDEISNDCPTKSLVHLAQLIMPSSSNQSFIYNNNLPFALGQSHYVPKLNCFRSYFDFKSAKVIKKESLKYLSQSLANSIQETNNINYHLQLIYALAFLASLGFSLLALLSLLFITCFSKLCLQCPFWFFGFFQMLAWLTSSFGIVTFLYQWYSNKHRSLDPLIRLPIENEILRLNSELLMLDEFGVAFWVALAATFISLIASIISCIICCRLPTNRHEDKEYKIMQLPAYT